MNLGPADLSRLEGVVAPEVLRAARLASQQLTRLGLRHALVGGLAVGVCGVPRATKDVDFLVEEGAFEHHAGGLVTMKPGVPIQVHGVLVDLLTAHAEDGALAEVPRLPLLGEVPVAEAEALVHLKLKSPRMKDAADIVELVKAGIDTARCREWLEGNAPSLVSRFVALVARAEAESA